MGILSTTIGLRRVVFAVAIAVAWSSGTAFPPRAAHAARHPLLVIAGRRYPEDSITLANLKTAFRGRRVNVGGRRMVPVNHPIGSRLRVAFDRTVLGLGPAAIGRYWIDRRIRDDGRPPKATPTAELAVRVVAALPNAITYGDQALCTAAVKVLRVDGKAAGTPGYPL